MSQEGPGTSNSVRHSFLSTQYYTRSLTLARWSPAQAVAIRPVTVMFTVDASFFQYGGGIYSPEPAECLGGVNHALVVVSSEQQWGLPHVLVASIMPWMWWRAAKELVNTWIKVTGD